MPDYKIYAGLGGGFGGADYHGTFEFKDEDEAWKYAYELACEEYESYSGYHGLRNIGEIIDEEGLNEVEAEELYYDEREPWLDYWVEEV